MNKTILKNGWPVIVLIAMFLFICPATTLAVVDGVTGTTVAGTTTFALTAKAGRISIPDGSQNYLWGYADGAGPAQYPGPTLIIDQGATVTVNLTNQIPTIPGNTPVNVSVVQDDCVFIPVAAICPFRDT